RLGLQVDSRYRRLCTVEHDVLHLLHVDVGRADGVEYAGEHAGAVQVAHHHRARGRRGTGEVDYVRDLARLLECPYDSNGLGRNGFLRLIGGCSNVMRSVNQARLHDVIRELARAAGRLPGEYVQTSPDSLVA